MTDTQSEQVETTDVMPVVEGSEIRLDALRLDGGTQSRDGLDEVTVKEYAEAMKENGTFGWPAIKVVFDGQNYWLVDGFHRVEAARRASHRYFKADTVQGTQRDAVLMSVGVNAIHGLRRTNADKRRAVETLLRDPEWNKWSDREIARLTATSNRFVGNVRNEITADALEWSYYPPEQRPVNESQTPNAQETRTVQRGGKTFEMKVGSIGADKRGGQGADTWALIERGAWKFMNGYYYAVDQKAKVIYFLDLQRGYKPINVATCEVFFPGCIAMAGASLNSDWQQYRAAGYTFKSPDEFPRKQPPPPDTELHPPGHSRNPVQPASQNLYPSLTSLSYVIDRVSRIIYTPGFDDPTKATEVCYKQGRLRNLSWAYRSVLGNMPGYEIREWVEPIATEVDTPWYEQSKFRIGMIAQCRKCTVQSQLPHGEWEPTEANKLWRCKKCGAKTADSLMKIIAPSDAHLSGETPTNGLTSEAIAKHRQLRGLVHFRMLNKYSRDAGRALQKINFEHGFEAASVAAKGMVSIYNKGAEQLMNASQKKGK